MNERYHDSVAACAHGVPQSDRAAVEVCLSRQLFDGDVVFLGKEFKHGETLSGKRLVEFETIDVVERESCGAESVSYRGNGTEPHVLRIDAALTVVPS